MSEDLFGEEGSIYISFESAENITTKNGTHYLQKKDIY